MKWNSTNLLYNNNYSIPLYNIKDAINIHIGDNCTNNYQLY